MRVNSNGQVIVVACLCPVCEGNWSGSPVTGYTCNLCDEGEVDEEEAKRLCEEYDIESYKYIKVI